MAKIQLGTKIVGGYSPYYGRTLYAYSSYPNVWIKDNTVKIEGLEASMTPVFQALQSLTTFGVSGGFPLCIFVITSGNDSDKHKKNSYHYKNRAVDISFIDGKTGLPIVGWEGKGATYAKFEAMINAVKPPLVQVKQDFTVIHKDTHIHVQYSPKTLVQEMAAPAAAPNGAQDGGTKQTEETLIAYTHIDPSVQSLSDLISTNPLFEGLKEDDVKSMKGPDGVTNEDRIKATYNNPNKDAEEKEEWPLLKPNTTIYVRPSSLTLDTLAIESSSQVKPFQDWEGYQTETQKALSDDETYRPAEQVLGKNLSTPFPVYQINSLCRVWIFSKILNKVLDVTPFCRSLSTNTSVGNDDKFSLQLAFLHDDEENLNFDSWLHDLDLQEKVWAVDAFKEGSLSFFGRVFSENDIVFLSYEELECEEGRDEYWDEIIKEITTDRLADQYYDFLGLVDTVSQESDAQGIGAVVINGSSLNKVFKIDESVFRPISALENSFSGSIILGDVKKRGFMRRMFVDGEYHSLFTDSLRTLQRTLQFYLNMVSNIGLLPLDDEGQENTELFSSWGSDRTKLVEIKSEGGSVSEGKEVLAKGVYQIIKLQMDPQVQSRHLADGTIVNPDGTIMSLLETTCQRPLIELLMDTYKNTYDLICRVPPFSRKSIVDWIEANNKTDFGTISIDKVAGENLDWETEFYTWFELQPKGSIIPLDELVSLCWIPTLFLTDYIDVWGSRRLSVVSPYTVIGSSNDTNSNEIAQAVQDLCWLVESHFYLPFTRRGTITLAVPDRRIKKGQWIKYEKTGEIFYVDGVQQGASISANSITRQTVLSVSRGLLEKYVNPSDKKGYFDIINFDALANSLKGFGQDNKKTTTLTPVVNKDLFKFFCSRKQFGE